MNNIVKTILFSSFCCLTTFSLSADKQQQLATKDATDQIMKICGHIYALSDSYAKWYPQKNPVVVCKSCKKRFLSLGDLSGALIIKALREIVYEEDSTWTYILINNLIELMAEGTFPELEQFLNRTMNKLQYRCSHCDEIGWEIAPENASNFTPAMHKKNIHL